MDVAWCYLLLSCAAWCYLVLFWVSLWTACKGHTEISDRDNAVLSQIFNPNLPFCEYNADKEQSSLTESGLTPLTKEVAEAKELELNGVKAAEAGNMEDALKQFNLAVLRAPDWPSTYNNRGQAYRLNSDNEAALQDLTTAITLSNGTGMVAKQAYTQRALLHKLAGKEKESMEDFKQAATLGNEFAKQQLLAANPYAAMCNAMLGEVFEKIRIGEQSVL